MARRRLLSDLWATYKNNVKQEEKISLEMFSEDGGITGLSGTSQIVYIECSGPWERSGNTPSWITLTPSSGKGGETKVTVSADEAPSTKDREGVVTISSQSTLEQLEIEVSQQGIQDFIKVEEIDGPYDSLDEGSSTYHADWCESGEVKSIKICYPKDSVTSPSAVGIYNINVSTVDSASSESYDYVTYSFKWASGETGTTHWQKHITFVTVNGASFTYNVYQDPKSFISLGDPSITNVPYSGTTGSVSYKTHNPAGLDKEYPSVTHPKVIVSADTYNAVLFGTSSDNCSSTTVTLSDKEGTLYYKVLARDNQAFSDRNIKVTFTCEDYSATGDCANASGYTDFTLSQGGYPYIAINPNNKSVGANASSFTLSVSSNTSWSLTVNSGWISSLSKTSGNSGLTSGIVCKYNENTNVATSRTATITATSSILTSVSATCVVTQSAATPYIYINGSTNGAASVSNSATSYSITIESNDDWTLSVDNGGGLTPYVGTGDSSSTINFGQNTDSEPIYYTITAKTTYGASATFTLAQRGALWLIPSYSAGAIVSSADTSDSAQQSITIRVPSGATSVQVSFSSSGAWSKVAYGDTVNWCSANTTNGANGTVITYTILANDSIEERTTESAFTYNLDSQLTSDYEYSVIFIQEGQDPYLNLKSGTTEVNSETVKGTGRTITITADTNCTWDVYDYTQGLTVIPSGNNTRSGGTIKINVPSTEIVSTGIVKTYVVTIKTNDSAIKTSEQITKTYTIKQLGVAPYVMFVDDPYSVTADTTTTVTGYVRANTPWRITVDGDYVTGVEPETGSTGLSEVEFTVEQYTATTSTTAPQEVASSLFPTGANDSTNIIIGAFSPILSANSSSVTLLSSSGSASNIMMYSNTVWKVNNEPSWLKVDASGSTHGSQGNPTGTKVVFTARSSNTSPTQRSDSVTFSCANYPLVCKTITVSQNGTGITTNITLGSTVVPAKGGFNNLLVWTNGTDGGTLYLSDPYPSTSTTAPSSSVFSNYSSIGSYNGNNSTAIKYQFPENTSTETYNWYRAYTSDGKGSLIFYQAKADYTISSTFSSSNSVSWSGETFTGRVYTNDPNGWIVKSTSSRAFSCDVSAGNSGDFLKVIIDENFAASGTSSYTVTLACASDTSTSLTITFTQSIGDGNRWVPTVYIDWKYDSVSYSTTANTLYYTANTNFSVTCTSETNFSTTNNVTVVGKLLSTTGSITISGFGSNSSESDRVFWASISVDLDGYSMSDMYIGIDVSFTQNAYSPEISVSQSTVTVTTPQSGTTSAIYVYASDKWSADVSDMPDWATLSTTTGTGNATAVYISYEDNGNTTPRTSGSITFALVDYPSYTAELTISATSASAAECATTYTNITLVFTQNETARWDFEFYTDGFDISLSNPLIDFGIYINDTVGYATPLGGWYGTGGSETNINTAYDVHGCVITKLGEPISVTAGTANQFWHTYSNGTHTYTMPKYDIQVYAFDVITPTLELSTDTISYSSTTITISVSSNTSWVVSYDSLSYISCSYCTQVTGAPSPSSITGSGNTAITFTVPQNYSASTLASDREFSFTGTTTYGHVDTYITGYGVPEATASTIVEQEGYDDRITPIINVTPDLTYLSSGVVSFSATVECTENIPWKAGIQVSDGIVLGITGDTGTGDGTIELKVSGYTATTYYTITVTTTADSSVVVENDSDSCTVTQEAASTIKNHLEGATTIEADETATTITVVTTNNSVTWTLDGGGLEPVIDSGLVISSSIELSDSNNSDLILGAISIGATLSPSAGTGTTYSVAKIPTRASVTITAAFTGGTPSSDTLTITRKGTLNLTGSSSVGSGVTSTTLTITTVNKTDTWTLSSSNSWCTLSQASGTGGKSVTVTFSTNTATVARSTTFTLTSNGKSVTLTLTQDKAVVENTVISLGFVGVRVDRTDYLIAVLNSSTGLFPSTFTITLRVRIAATSDELNSAPNTLYSFGEGDIKAVYGGGLDYAHTYLVYTFGCSTASQAGQLAYEVYDVKNYTFPSGFDIASFADSITGNFDEGYTF
jgi:hypothetical protein